MPYECDEASRIAFKNELSVIHSVLENNNYYYYESKDYSDTLH